MRLRNILAVGFVFFSAYALATPEFVTHNSGDSVFGEPSGTTMRNPLLPREDEVATIFAKIGYQFFYTNVAIYYTTDQSVPTGIKGVPSGSTQVIPMSFLRNESTPGGIVDWWKVTMPISSRVYSQQIKYKIGAWHTAGGPEIWSNNSGCSDGVCDNPGNPAITHSWTNFLAWPGAGAGSSNPAAGYPSVNFWKEEAMSGNKYMNVMLDQNGTLYDIFYPGAGGINGVGTKNEGYVGGLDTFPPGLPIGNRGQMHLNQLQSGIRVDGVTHWLSNPGGVSYTAVTQSYVTDTNVIQSSARLTNGGNNILVEQYDFVPYELPSWPLDQGNVARKGFYVKRYILKNQGASAKIINFYSYGDFAINGGDGSDVMYSDNTRNAMVAYDNAGFSSNSRGEYNPTTFPDYSKNNSIFFATALKTLDTIAGSSGNWATDTWRTSSSDNGQGWIGTKITLAPGASKEVNLIVAGGYDNFANATGTYGFQVAPVLDWFKNNSMATAQATTETQWRDWLAEGTTVDFPDNNYDALFKRGLLGTALHLDEKGGVVAGYHNGAYPYVWPRDAVYAAVALAKTGHTIEARNVYNFLRETCFRGTESWGKGFFNQKYTTDGYIVWSSPQVDETAVLPWGLLNLYNTTGQLSDLTTNYQMAMDSGYAMSSDSNLDSRLYYDDVNKLMNSMNVWEDSFDDFIYSNANVWRGLKDASEIALKVNGANAATNASTFNSRASEILLGLRGRLAWNGENTDISQLGLVYPFNVLSPIDSDVSLVVNRMNGTANDRNGNNKPIVINSGEFTGLVNRYWGDNYWNGGPWFLSTLWYGLYYADRADYTAGNADITTLKSKIDLTMNHLGNVGFGAEQIAPSNSLLYPGQSDFSLQAAWPNAWESMSTYMDSLMAFLDWTPDAPTNTLRVSPKLPSGWAFLRIINLVQGTDKFDVRLDENTRYGQVTLTNKTGASSRTFDVWMKIPLGSQLIRTTVMGVPTSTTYDPLGHRVRIQGALRAGINAVTAIRTEWTATRKIIPPGDIIRD